MKKKQQTYDVFISYRRAGGAQYARNLQVLLQMRGYKVFLDYDELIEGFFRPEIEAAIRNSDVYLLVLSEGALDRCNEEGNWVRREIEIALDAKKVFVPINADNSYKGMPADVPEAIRHAVEETQHQEVRFGQPLQSDIDLLVKRRIKPYVSKRKRRGKALAIVAACIAGAALCAGGFFALRSHELKQLKQGVEFNGAAVVFSSEAGRPEVMAAKEILSQMKYINGGSFTQGADSAEIIRYADFVEPDFETPASRRTVEPFYLGSLEVSERQWNAVMRKSDSGGELPVRAVSYSDAEAFCRRLSTITGLLFRLPSETEWEYAARGGARPEGYVYAGGERVSDVAWCRENSSGAPEARLLTGTIDDIFNLSGNVAEWCADDFLPYNEAVAPIAAGLKVVRGGSYGSEEYELTVFHRDGVAPDQKSEFVGFRVAI